MNELQTKGCAGLRPYLTSIFASSLAPLTFAEFHDHSPLVTVVTSSARVDMSNMVSNATSSADRTPSATSTVVESNDPTAQRQASPSTVSDSHSRVACVRRELKSQEISKDASEVILQSWTPGSQKLYNKP